jgi:hypothetical protein
MFARTTGCLIFALFLFPVLFAPGAAAQEIHLFGGAVQERASRDRSYSWAVQYLEGLGENWAVSFSWLNEGHFEHHHRDGHTLQIWARTKPLWKRFVLAAGIGPYRYYDTQLAKEGASYVDSHGWGIVTSFSASWHLNNRWIFSLQSNFVETSRSIDSHSLLAGIGYQLDAPAPPDEKPATAAGTENAARNEIAVFGGQTVVNSRDSENALALMLEYRRNLGRHFDWTVGWLYEGDPGPVNRHGMLSQLWLVRRFFDDRLALSVGGGAYIPVDRHRKPGEGGDDDPTLAGIATMAAGYEFRPPWMIRIAWNRIVTDYNRDTDVFLAGIGLRF